MRPYFIYSIFLLVPEFGSKISPFVGLLPSVDASLKFLDIIIRKLDSFDPNFEY